MLTDPLPTPNGYSVGKWDGDTLVVETSGISDGEWLDRSGNPLTGAANDHGAIPARQLRTHGD